MANDVNRLIDMICERIEDAKAPAFKPNLATIDRDEILDLMEELRNALPVELKKAQELLAAREKFVDDAKRDVEHMRRQAEMEVKNVPNASFTNTSANEANFLENSGSLSVSSL